MLNFEQFRMIYPHWSLYLEARLSAKMKGFECVTRYHVLGILLRTYCFLYALRTVGKYMVPTLFRSLSRYGIYTHLLERGSLVEIDGRNLSRSYLQSLLHCRGGGRAHHRCFPWLLCLSQFFFSSSSIEKGNQEL